LLCRASLALTIGFIVRQFSWEGFRYLTSEFVLRLSAMTGTIATRISFDTIDVHGQLLQIVISCTLVEMIFGSLPLLWRFDQSILRNLIRFGFVAVALFGLNIVRLEVAEIAVGHGLPWLIAHDIPLGCVYFAVWVFVWRHRSWRAWQGRVLDGTFISIRESCDLAR
jgi:hypothetical protein